MSKAAKLLGMSATAAKDVLGVESHTGPKEPPPPVLNVEKHVGFLLHHLKCLPTPYASQESNRITLLYFVLSSLDVLGAIDKVDKAPIIEWVYALQLLSCSKDPEKNTGLTGWRGSLSIGAPYNPTGEAKHECVPHDRSHIAMVYTALCVLALLEDDFSRVNRKGVIAGLRTLQQENGSFAPTAGGSESDMRFVYCAFAISTLLNDWSGVNVDRAIEYILSSQSYESSIGQGPSQEGHGGSTYCAVAALQLAGKLDLLPRHGELVEWCVNRQSHGFNGRCNKDADTCYSFWVGGTLQMLTADASSLIDYQLCTSFTFCCEGKETGGFAKVPGNPPDVLHTYYSLCGISILDPRYQLAELHVPLSITKRAHTHLMNNIWK